MAAVERSPSRLEDGPVVVDAPAPCVGDLPQRLKAFVGSDPAHRRKYLQQCFGFAFDGYSYIGQTDSRNQGAEDLLHSFVFSDFYSADRYPQELRPYIESHWRGLTRFVRKVESALLDELGLDLVAAQHQRMAHMMSANYYPPIVANSAPVRLTEHPDASLVTVFPFGVDDDFEYQDAAGRWRRLPSDGGAVAFAGHLLEWMSGGRAKALNHRVRLGGSRRERFSFALFSLPRSGAVLRRVAVGDGPAEMTTAEYLRWHLSRWD